MSSSLCLRLLALPLLILGSSAQAQEVEVGAALLCDTQQQVERYVSVYDGDALSTINSVNAAEHDQTACGMNNIVYVRGQRVAVARNKDKTFYIAPILVLGIVTEQGVRSMAPTRYFSGFEIQEIAI
jgi:hypothetical protein